MIIPPTNISESNTEALAIYDFVEGTEVVHGGPSGVTHFRNTRGVKERHQEHCRQTNKTHHPFQKQTFL